MYNFGECSEEINNSIVSLKEKKSKFILHNHEKLILFKVKVDGCLINKGSKCDWLLVNTKNHQALFVELKGRDIKHAFEQIENSINIICNKKNTYISEPFSKCHVYIVSSKVLKSAILQKVNKNFKKKFKDIHPLVKNREMTININNPGQII